MGQSGKENPTSGAGVMGGPAPPRASWRVSPAPSPLPPHTDLTKLVPLLPCSHLLLLDSLLQFLPQGLCACPSVCLAPEMLLQLTMSSFSLCSFYTRVLFPP